MNVKNIDELYYYRGEDLGCTVENNIYTFRVWSPIAKEVKLCIYEDYESKYGEIYSMIRVEKGVWHIGLTNVANKYYTYLVKIEDEDEVVDPYAKAVSINGQRGFIINLEDTNPVDWRNQKIPKVINGVDSIIYEVNIRDISIDKNSGITYRGKFLGLAEENTVVFEEIKTGLEHIKDLGITHVQLMPICDFGSIDEKDNTEKIYNWGYDPVNYNSPEGSYSTDPYDPLSRIKELKIAIRTLHENEIGVIMDVVYNHIYNVSESNFNKLMPGYFFRVNESGKPSDESGCGNVIASENLMVRKFIVDSVKFWAKEYKIDGFRFDLMGLIDIDTMNEIKNELTTINPSIIILGEGWDMGWTLKHSEKSIQANAYKLKNIAFFNDDIRDALRGSCFDINSKGFLNGSYDMDLRIKKGIVGGINYSSDICTWGDVDVNQVVNYVECHDNNTLFDRLGNQYREYDKIKYMHRLGDSIILLSQGIPFIHAGQEFLRTKYGVENSYNSGDEINKLDWNRKKDNIETVQYFKGLIELRKKEEVFRLKNIEDIRASIEFIETEPRCIGYFINKRNSVYHSDRILVIHNANEEAKEINIGVRSQWKIVVNKYRAGVDSIEIIDSERITIEGVSTLVAYF